MQTYLISSAPEQLSNDTAALSLLLSWYDVIHQKLLDVNKYQNRASPIKWVSFPAQTQTLHVGILILSISQSEAKGFSLSERQTLPKVFAGFRAVWVELSVPALCAAPSPCSRVCSSGCPRCPRAASPRWQWWRWGSWRRRGCWEQAQAAGLQHKEGIC